MIRSLFTKIGDMLRQLGKSRSPSPSAPDTLPVAAPSALPSAETGQALPQDAPKKRRRRRKPKSEAGETATPSAQAEIPAQAEAEWNPASFVVPEEAGKTRFQDLNLPAPLMRAIADLGFQYCTPIQAQILPHLLAGKDGTGRAQTGTGKTAAFLLTILTRQLREAEEHKRHKGTPRALILAPTRELVIQIGKEAEVLSQYTGLKILTVFGGMDYIKQQKHLQQPVDIIVATPGRLLDFHRRKDVHLSRVETLVLDEADRMLDMGFIPDVRQIVVNTPPKSQRQTLLFSATFDDEVMRLIQQWTRDPVTVEVEPERVAAENVDQVVYIVTNEEKYTLLYNLITQKNLQRVMIFTNQRHETRKLSDRLRHHGIRCAMISGDVPQDKRIKTLEDFRAGKIRVLVATDVAGRGIHVEGISHVINYTLPMDAEDYVHRIGRTGRAGQSGTSISFASEDDAFQLPEIEAFLGQPLPCQHPAAELLLAPPAPEKSEKTDRPPRSNGERRSRGPRRPHPPRTEGNG